MSPFLRSGTKIEFMGPAVAALLMGKPIRFGNRGGLGETVGGYLAGLNPPGRLHAPMNGFAVDAGVDDEMDDVNVLGPELARHGLGQRAKAELCRREGGKPLAAANACGRTGKKDGAASARQHDARGFAPHQEAGVAGQLPGLEEELFGRLQQGLVDVRTGIEKADLDRPDVALDVREQLLDLRFLASINAEGVNAVAFRPELIHKRLGFGRIASADANSVAAAGKP